MSWKLALAADDYPAKAVSIIKHCYDNTANKDSNIAHCIQVHLRKVPDPLDYHVRVIATDPDNSGIFKVKIIMINKTGLIVYCLGTGDKVKLSMKACVKEKGEPLTPSQKHSIDSDTFF